MTPHNLTQRHRILFTILTALTFRYPSGREPALIPALRAWLSGWPGIGRIALGMADHQLTRYDGLGWRATFFPEGRAHSLPAAVPVGSACLLGRLGGWRPSCDREGGLRRLSAVPQTSLGHPASVETRLPEDEPSHGSQLISD